MPAVCLYFQVHQPYRIKPFSIYAIGSGDDYFNDTEIRNTNNRYILEKVARKSYLPTNELLLELLEENPQFKISFSFSGVFLDQCIEYMPDVLASFQKLIRTGQVEVLAETYYHSLAVLYSEKEFAEQVRLHTKKIEAVFHTTPRVFRNTELIYSDAIGDIVEKLGYSGILAEGADYILGWKSPNFIYTHNTNSNLRLLLKNYRLSDDIAFRFGSKEWTAYPLTADTFAHWIHGHNGNADSINLFMDFETFGEHQWEDTGIFEFVRQLPQAVLKDSDSSFITPSEAFARFPARESVSMPNPVSWADIERDLSAWRSNPLQHDALKEIYALEDIVCATKNAHLIDTWRKLQTSDHFYYMCTKWFADGDVHAYFNPYQSPYEAYISYMNVLKDFEIQIKKHISSQQKNKWL